MRDVYIVGTHSTSFGKKPEQSFKDLTRETYLGVLADVGWERGDGSDARTGKPSFGADARTGKRSFGADARTGKRSFGLDFIYFGNCAMHGVKQGTIRGQACTVELVDSRLIPRRTPLINVEGGCATGSMAIHSAAKDIASGESDVVLAMGVEKLFIPKAASDPTYKKKMMKGFMNGVDNFDLPRMFAEYERAAQQAGVPFGTGEDRSFFMDTYGVQAALHMKRYGTTQRQLACAAATSHNYGALNPLAQYRFEMTVDEVLADREISYPLTRSMCTPIGDGAASALLCSEDALAAMPTETQRRAVKIRASVLTGGYYKDIDEPSLSRVAADRAYAKAGLGPNDVDVVEVHDASSFSVIYQLEMLRLASEGGGGPMVESGATGPGGSLPVNTSGGLVSKGHPVGATGISMVHELCLQLRGEAGERQVPGARIALQENGGGVIGLEEAACSVMLLEKT